jgi:cytochrome c-type biogenesis protein CcmH/NrfF
VKARLALAALGAVLGVAVASGALASDGTAARSWGYDLANHLMSPYCPGRTLPDCPSEQAAELRHWIVAQDAAGRTQADVEQQLYAQFGDIILQAPRASGIGIAAYLVPALLFLGGGGFLMWFLRRQTVAARAGQPAPPSLRPIDPELERLVDSELRDPKLRR